jgi:glycine dehydrogenase
LSQLEATDAFISAILLLPTLNKRRCWQCLGYADRTALIDAIVPANIRRHDVLPLG